MFFLTCLTAVLAVAWLIPAAVFVGECLVSCLPGRLRQPALTGGPRPRVAVLIPAHNEEDAVAGTVRALAGRLSPGDCVLVVADNCSDATAAAARAAGAMVTERFHATRRGKGFALAHGLEVLAASPPDVVFVLDADCRTGPGTLRRTADLAHATGRPVQSLNLCGAAGRGGLQAVSELSLRFKNLVRPLGLARLGLPCHLMGTGMALPWSIVAAGLPLGEDLAEDMRLGVDLALAGKSPLFCMAGRIESGLPTDAAGFVSQRTRWEQGHLRTTLTHAPRLIWAGLRTANLRTLALGLDLLVPPLALFVLTWAILVLAVGTAWLVGAAVWPFVALLTGGGLFFSAIALGWAVFCRRQVPVVALLAVPGFVFRKLPIYARFLLGRGQKQWVRTPRATSPVS